MLIGFAAFILIINTLRLAAYSKKKEIKIMRLLSKYNISLIKIIFGVFYIPPPPQKKIKEEKTGRKRKT